MASAASQPSSKVIKFNQEVMETQSDKLAAKLEQVFKNPPDTLILDMDKVKRLDFVGLGLIFTACRQAEGSGSRITLTNTSAEIEALIHAMHLHQEVDIAPRD